MREGKIENLPKWAQQEIARLRRNLIYAEKKLSAGPEGSIVFADPYSDSKRPLGNPTIQFVFDDDRDYINVKHEGDHIEIYGGNVLLSVRPRASNVVQVVPERR